MIGLVFRTDKGEVKFALVSGFKVVSGFVVGTTDLSEFTSVPTTLGLTDALGTSSGREDGCNLTVIRLSIEVEFIARVGTATVNDSETLTSFVGDTITLRSGCGVSDIGETLSYITSRTGKR